MGRISARFVGAYLLFVIFFSVSPIQAQEISNEKLALIRELFSITGMSQTENEISDKMFTHLENNFSTMITQLVSQDGVEVDWNREECKRLLIESSTRFLRRLRKVYLEEIDLEQLTEKVYYPLYDKYYSESELRELISFYKSPIGQKATAVSPQIMLEGMQRYFELVNPNIIRIVNRLMQEEREFLKTDLRTAGIVNAQ